MTRKKSINLFVNFKLKHSGSLSAHTLCNRQN